jgi:hypothetical protein
MEFTKCKTSEKKIGKNKLAVPATCKNWMKLNATQRVRFFRSCFLLTPKDRKLITSQVVEAEKAVEVAAAPHHKKAASSNEMLRMLMMRFDPTCMMAFNAALGSWPDRRAMDDAKTGMGECAHDGETVKKVDLAWVRIADAFNSKDTHYMILFTVIAPRKRSPIGGKIAPLRTLKC